MTALTYPEPSERWATESGDIVEIEGVTATSVLVRDGLVVRWVPLTAFVTDHHFYDGGGDE